MAKITDIQNRAMQTFVPGPPRGPLSPGAGQAQGLQTIANSIWRLRGEGEENFVNIENVDDKQKRSIEITRTIGDDRIVQYIGDSDGDNSSSTTDVQISLTFFF